MTHSSSDTPSSRGRVLVVEATSVFREVQSLLLARAGYEVVTCQETDTALAVLAETDIDVMVVNRDGPLSEGTQLLSNVRRLHPEIAIVFIATMLTVEVSRDANRIGGVTVLQRPVEPQLLAQKIEEAMAVVPHSTRQIGHVDTQFGLRSSGPGNLRWVSGIPGGSHSPFSHGQSGSPFATTDSAIPFAYYTAPCGSASASPFPGFPYR